MLVLPARQGVVVRVSFPSATGSSGTSHCVSQCDREQWYMLVLPAWQGAVVRVGSPSAAGSSGACWFSQRGREQWCVLVLLLFGLCFLMTSVSPTSGLLVPRCESDSAGRFIQVECGSKQGSLYLDKLGDKGKRGSKCVLSDSKWYTPLEFEKLGGKSSRKWKMSLTHRGRPLSEYSLDCGATATDAVGSVSNIPSSAAAATQSTNIPSNAAVAAQSSNTMLIDVPLAFIKAFRLRGDKVNLRSNVLERFDQAAIIEQSKQSLWEACKSDLDAGGLCFCQRRSSDRRAQIEADLDHVLAAFDLLDSKALIPPIFCEASELYRLPSLSLDPVSEQVQDNTKALLSLTSVVNSIEKKMSSFFVTSAVTRPFPPQNTIPDSEAPLSYSAAVTEGAQVESHLPNPREATYRPQMRRDAFTVDSNDRHSNLLVFGLPESSSLMETKEKVDNMLTYLTGTTIGVRDLFRIGRFKKEAEHTSRPVLVKLSSAWDCKVVLLNKRKLKNYALAPY